VNGPFVVSNRTRNVVGAAGFAGSASVVFFGSVDFEQPAIDSASVTARADRLVMVLFALYGNPYTARWSNADVRVQEIPTC
jgi:hypothetical protein